MKNANESVIRLSDKHCSSKLQLNTSFPQMKLRLYFNGGKHMIRHEYHTYETYSFIADVGGYLVSKTIREGFYESA